MKQICTHCGRLASEGARWCQNRESNCPPGTLSLVFEHGEMLGGEIQITQIWRVFRMSVIYHAQRGKQPVWVKVAHRGCEEPLKEEARLLALLTRRPQAAYPQLVSAYSNERRAYGRDTIQGEAKYYIVYKPARGQFLRDMLIQSSQLFSQHAIWIGTQLANALAYLHLAQQRLLLNLHPDNILIRTDKNGIPRPMLLDLMLAAPMQQVDVRWAQTYGVPAYLAPEQIRGELCTPATDVYSLGLLIYEMLAGQPAYSAKMRQDDEVRELVVNQYPTPLNQCRPELNPSLVGIVHKALDKNPARRQPDLRSFAKGMQVMFGAVPAEPRSGLDRRTMIILLAVIGVVALALLAWLIL